MRRVPLLRRLGPPLVRVPPCRCPGPGAQRLGASLSTAADSGAPGLEANAELEGVHELALSKGKMKRLKAIAAQKGIDITGASRPELVQRILSAGPRADTALDQDERQQPPCPHVEYSEQLKQLSNAYHQLVSRLVAQGNNTAVNATLTRARAAGVEDWVLQTALEQQPMPNLDGPVDPVVADEPDAAEIQGRLQASQEQAAQEAEESKRREQELAAAAAEDALRRRAQQLEQIEQAIAVDERSAAQVRADCNSHGLSTAATRDELLRRLMLHQIWDDAELDGKLPADMSLVTLQHYTAAQLKKWCTDRGLPQTGTKGDLIERLERQEISDSPGRGSSREIRSDKKYDLWAMNQSGNQSTTFIGIRSSVCYVDLGPGHIDQMGWVKSARRILNLSHDGSESKSYGVGMGEATGSELEFWADEGNFERRTTQVIQRDLSLPRSVHGYFAKETLPGTFGREQLRTTYDVILSYLVPQVELHGAVMDPMQEAYENMQRAERMLNVAERSLSSSGSLLVATGQLTLSQALELVARMDQSFVDVMELSQGAALARARKVMNVLTQRANMSIDRERTNLAPQAQLQSQVDESAGVVTGTVVGIEARRLVEQWISPSNRQNAAAMSSSAAFGPNGPTLYKQSEERTCEMISRELAKNRLFEPDATDFYLILGKNKVEAFGHGQFSGPESSLAMRGHVDLDWQLRLNGFVADLERQSPNVSTHGHRLEQQAHKENRTRWAKPTFVRLGSSNDKGR